LVKIKTNNEYFNSVKEAVKYILRDNPDTRDIKHNDLLILKVRNILNYPVPVETILRNKRHIQNKEQQYQSTTNNSITAQNNYKQYYTEVI